MTSQKNDDNGDFVKDLIKSLPVIVKRPSTLTVIGHNFLFFSAYFIGSYRGINISSVYDFVTEFRNSFYSVIFFCFSLYYLSRQWVFFHLFQWISLFSNISLYSYCFLLLFLQHFSNSICFFLLFFSMQVVFHLNSFKKKTWTTKTHNI